MKHFEQFKIVSEEIFGEHAYVEGVFARGYNSAMRDSVYDSNSGVLQ